jgi:hypothetical protein
MAIVSRGGAEGRVAVWTRIARVTGLLSLAGACVGAVAGGVTLVALEALPALWGGFAPEFVALGIGPFVGGALGAVLFPAAGWLLMRHVPIGRALLATLAGTWLGALVALSTPLSHSLLAVLGIPVVGFVIAAVVVRVRASAGHRRDAASQHEPT